MLIQHKPVAGTDEAARSPRPRSVEDLRRHPGVTRTSLVLNQHKLTIARPTRTQTGHTTRGTLPGARVRIAPHAGMPLEPVPIIVGRLAQLLAEATRFCGLYASRRVTSWW